MMEKLMESKTCAPDGPFVMRKGLSCQEWTNHTGDHKHGEIRVVCFIEG
jgi:hypothetical protein